MNTGNAENDIQILLSERCHVFLGETLIQHVGSAFTVQSCIFHIGTGDFQKVLMADIVTAVHEVGETDVDTVGIRSKDHMQWLRAVDDSGQTVFFQPFIPGIYRVSQGRVGKPRIGISAESVPRDEIVSFFRGVGLLHGSALLLLCDFSALIRRQKLEQISGTQRFAFHFTAAAASLRLHESGIFPVMTEGVDDFLLLQNLSADRAVTALGEAGFSTGR